MHAVSFIRIGILLAVCLLKTALGLTCLSCNSVPDITHCINSVTCTTNTEQCFVDKTVLSNLTVVYTAGCRETQICNILEGLNGKRDVFHEYSRYKKSAIECTHCCNSAGTNNIPCNRYLCNQNLGLRCLSFHGASNIANFFNQTVTCKDGEECYLETVFNPDLTVVFNAGCRAKMICDFIGSFGKRSILKRQSTACARCCNTAPNAQTNIPCNGYLCNQVNNPQGYTCAVCDRVDSFDTCTTYEQCPSNEVCSNKFKISGNTPVFELGCEQKAVCDHILKSYMDTHMRPAGRSDHGDVDLCAACCTGRNCNKANCSELIKNQTCNDPSICGH